MVTQQPHRRSFNSSSSVYRWWGSKAMKDQLQILNPTLLRIQMLADPAIAESAPVARKFALVPALRQYL